MLQSPHFPLFDFFQALREWEKQLNQQSLTLVEYEAMIKALDNCPFPLNNQDDYYKLCKLVWYKPFHEDKTMAQNTEEGTFKILFDDFWGNVESYNALTIKKDEKLDDTKKESEKSKENTRTITPEELKQREEEQKKIQQQQQQQQNISTENNNDLTPYWADFTPQNRGEVTSATQSNSNIIVKQEDGTSAETKQNFTFLEKYQFLPLEYRRLYQMLMSIRRIAFDGGRSDLDVQASFKQLIKQGYLAEFTYAQRARRWLGVHLLIDMQGSMAPFEHMGEVIEGIIRGDEENGVKTISAIKKSHVWYFHNCPMSILYKNKDLYDSEKISNWEQYLKKQAPAQIIIFSDAGAARGFRSSERINETVKFLQQLRNHHTVWINPVPQKRWQGTAAAAIARYVTMFDASDASFVMAMQSIKGK